MSDNEIDTTDISPLSEDFFHRAKWRVPGKPVDVTLKIDPLVLAWFKAQGEDWQQRLNAALRIYAESHRLYGKQDETAA